MEPVHRLDPRADRDAAAPATGPLPLIHSPQDETLLRVDPPLAKTGIVVNRIGDPVARLSSGNGPCRAVLGTTLTGHTEVMEPERDRLIGLKRQVRRHRLETHVVAVFRGEDSPGAAEFP